MKEKEDWLYEPNKKLVEDTRKEMKFFVNKLRANGLIYKNQNGHEEIRKRFSLSEISPENENHMKLLGQQELLRALGIDQDEDLKVENAPIKRKGSNDSTEGVWPTNIPYLNYIRVSNPASSVDDEFFEVYDSDVITGRIERLSEKIQKKEKKDLLSDILAKAREIVEDVKNKDPRNSLSNIDKEFMWNKFVPKNDYGVSVWEADVLNALGIDPDLKVEEAPNVINPNPGITKGIWPTLVPDLYYIKSNGPGLYSSYSYFAIMNKSHSEWNEEMWAQEDAKEKAHKELNDLGKRYDDLPK